MEYRYDAADNTEQAKTGVQNADGPKWPRIRSIFQHQNTSSRELKRGRRNDTRNSRSVNKSSRAAWRDD